MNPSLPFLPVLLLLPALTLGCASGSESTVAPDPAWTTALASAPTGPLDGARFDVRIVDPSAPGTGDDDVLEFAGGRFHSTACDPYGFGSGPCTASRDGDAIRFESTCTNAAGDTNTWHGTVRGAAIEGGFTWTPKRGVSTTRTYRGSRRR